MLVVVAVEAEAEVEVVVVVVVVVVAVVDLRRGDRCLDLDVDHQEEDHFLEDDLCQENDRSQEEDQDRDLRHENADLCRQDEDHEEDLSLDHVRGGKQS